MMADSRCEFNHTISRTCELGSDGCGIRHKDEACADCPANPACPKYEACEREARDFTETMQREHGLGDCITEGARYGFARRLFTKLWGSIRGGLWSAHDDG